MIALPTTDEPVSIVEGDALETLRALPDACVRCCVTSPPYYGLRSYIPPGSMRLRADLTQAEVDYVMAELAKAGVIPDSHG